MTKLSTWTGRRFLELGEIRTITPHAGKTGEIQVALIPKSTKILKMVSTRWHKATIGLYRLNFPDESQWEFRAWITIYIPVEKEQLAHLSFKSKGRHKFTQKKRRSK